MKREELEALGLSKEQIDTIMDINGNDINAIRTKLEQAQTKLDKANESITARDQQLEALKASTGDIEQIKAELAKAQADNQAAAEKYNADIKDLTMTSAIKSLITGKVHDEDLALNLFDKSKMILNEDGTITGLQDQLTAIQAEKAFLFKGEEKADKTAGFKFGTPSDEGQKSGQDDALRAAFGLEE